MKQLYDVIIVGGGVVGNAITGEMSGYRLKTSVLERNPGVCYEASSQNSGMIYGGLTYGVSPLKTRLRMEGNQFIGQLAGELDFKFVRCGKVPVGNTAEDMETLKRTIRQGEENGTVGLKLTGKERLHQLAPAVVGKFAIFSANSEIVDPFNYIIALAEDTHTNRAAYYFDHEVTRTRRDSEGNYIFTTLKGEFHTRWVASSVGLGCNNISDMSGIRGYKVIGSKGDYIILDKCTGCLLPMPVYPVPSNTYMGIRVINTTNGNAIIKPNAEMVTDLTCYGVPQEDMDYLAKSASDLWPCTHKKDYIRNYSGILPKWVDEDKVMQDFRMEIRDDIALCTINLVSVESLGLTAAVSITRHAISLMEEREKLAPNPGFNPMREGIPHFAGITKEEQEQMIRQNPDYGQVVCQCEKVIRVEILTAIHSPLRVNTMAGVEYRTRSMMERCQGGHCQTRIAQVIEDELGEKTTEVRYARKDSQMLFSRMWKET